MSLVDNNALLHGFRPTIRTLHVTVADLRILRGWNAYGLFSSADDPPPEPAIWEKMFGVATLGADAITVIGSEQTPIRQLSFELYAFTDWNSLSDHWESHKKDWGGPLKDIEEGGTDGDDARLVQYLRNVYSRLDGRPPTSFLSFSKADWELGRGDEWNLSCEVPKIVFDTLVSDHLHGRCRTLSISLTLSPTLVSDEYAPPSVPVTFGILRLGKHDGGTGRGWVEHLSWESMDKPQLEAMAGSAHTTDNDSANQEPPEISAAVQQSLQESIRNLNKEILSLVSTTRKGFVFVLLLILLIKIIRR